MRLSTAMMLGSVTCKMVPGNWNSCAIGSAANAVGIPNWGNEGIGRHVLIWQYWPWLGSLCSCGCGSFGSHIWNAFDDNVCKGKMTIEQLIDWVRSVEPELLALPAPALSQNETELFCEPAKVLL